MGRVKGTLHVCDACGAQRFIDESVNTESGCNERGWYSVLHRGVPRELCKECYEVWDSWNRRFLKIVDVREEKK